MCELDGDNKTNLCICCTVTASILIIILIASCWDTVEPTEFGLKCNSISKTCNKEEVFESGRHLVGPTYYFISFPGSL